MVLEAFYTLPVTVILGLLIPGVAALAIGYFGFKSRVRGVYFAILTQAITVAGWLVFCMNNMKLCGTNGLTRFDRIAGFKLTNPHVKVSLYIITLLALVGVYALCKQMVRSRLGRILIAIRDDETTLRFSGYKPYIYKLFAFSLAGMIADSVGCFTRRRWVFLHRRTWKQVPLSWWLSGSRLAGVARCPGRFSVHWR